MVTGSYSYLSFVCFETSQINCVKLYNYSIWQYLYKLKEHCHEISDTFFHQKTPSEPHMNRQKRLQIFFCSRRYLQKTYQHSQRLADTVSELSTTTLTRCQHSQRLRRHYVSVVNSYADTMSAWSTTALTWCECSQRLHGHCVSVVNDHVVVGHTDTVSE